MRQLITLLESGMPEYNYVTNCTNSGHGKNGEAIHRMVEKSSTLDYDDVERMVGREQLAEVFSDYDWSDDPTGMTLKSDWAVSYAQSKWRGIPCVYVQHSRIEYIFTLNGRMPSRR